MPGWSLRCWRCLGSLGGLGVALEWGLGGHDEKQPKGTPLVHQKGAPRTTKKSVRAQFVTAGAQNGFQRAPWGAEMGPKRDPGGKGGSKMHRWSPRGGKRQCQPPFCETKRGSRRPMEGPKGGQGEPRGGTREPKGPPKEPFGHPFGPPGPPSKFIVLL